MPKYSSQGGLLTKTRIEKPKMYNVVFHNDDITTMEFVVHVLRVVFFKSTEQATQLMLNVHHDGSAIVGTYTYDIALSKANKSMLMAKESSFPLRITVIPQDPNDLPF